MQKNMAKIKTKNAEELVKMEEMETQAHIPTNQAQDNGIIQIGDDEGTFYCLSIIGQIEGHYILDNSQKTTKYDHIIPLLVALEESKKVDGIIILINTLGGDVEAGLAIAEVIASIRKPTASIVLGGGHSIGVPLAVSADRSFIVPSATMTIHPVRTTGTVLGVPQAFDYLDKMQNRIIKFITDHSSVSENDFRKMISRTDVLVNDIGSILDGPEAVGCGLIDCIGGISDALDFLKNARKNDKK